MNALKENFVKARLHLDRLQKASAEIEEKAIIKNLDIDDFEIVKVLDTFIFRFTKLQDFLGQKLFRRFLDEIGELEESMSFLDVLDRLERLEVIGSSEEWIKIRKLRNQLTHEYPEELEETKEELVIAMQKVKDFEDVIEKMQTYLKKRDLFFDISQKA